MRNHSSTYDRPLRVLPAFLVLAAAAAFFVPRLHAQAPCPDGADTDALGCSNQQSLSSSTQNAPSTISVTEHSQNQTPSPDHSSEASATHSLSNDSSYSENAPRKTRIGPEMRAPAPDVPTEFQNYVAASTGQMLKVYGAQFFLNQPALFVPAQQGPAPVEMVIGPEDELRIRIWGQVNFSANLRVSREGEIYLPKVGAVHVAGLPFSAVPAQIREAMNRVYRNFDMSVDLGDIHNIQIYAAGMARQPGEYSVSALNTLVDAVFAVGGPSTAGSMRHVQLKRGGKLVADFDLYALLANGDKSGDVQLQAGDVLYIPPTGAQVALFGSARQTGIFELRGQESIGQLLKIAGGETPTADRARLSIDRIEDNARRAFQIATDPSSLNTSLVDGDIVRIDPILSVYHDAVTLRGAVASPGQFRWHTGMRLSELLPERDALLKRDYWWQRTRLGLPAPQLAIPFAVEVHNERLSAVQSPPAQTNWNQAVIERLDPSTMSTSLISFNLGKLVLEHDPVQNLELQAGDVVTIFSQQDIQPPIKEQAVYIELSGEFVHPGIYSASPQETLNSLVGRAGGLTRQAYPYAAVFTRKSTQLLEQARLNDFADQLDHQLARNAMAASGGANGAANQQAIALNRQMIERLRTTQASGRIVLEMRPQSSGTYELPPMHLEDGDRLIVPYVPETVQVFGAVFNPHAFLFHADTRVGQYLHFAGGPNRDADRKRIFVLRADGSVISRDSNPSVFADGFSKLHLQPGDSIVVPERNLHPSALSSVLGWSQIASGTAINALEISALK